MADSDSHWRRWGEIDPYFGVLSDERFRLGQIDANRDSFFQSGEAHVEMRLAEAERYFGGVQKRRALELGCGVGRLTLPLAAAFEEVVALDIAPAMLAEAQRNADARNLTNIAFEISDDALSRASGCFDFVISCIVLQHINSRRGLKIIEALLDKTAPGGVLSIQLCIGRNDSRASRLRFWLQGNIPGLHQLVNLKRGRPRMEPYMEMNVYPLDRVLALAEAANFGGAMLSSFTDGRFQSAELLMRRN